MSSREQFSIISNSPSLFSNLPWVPSPPSQSLTPHGELLWTETHISFQFLSFDAVTHWSIYPIAEVNQHFPHGKVLSASITKITFQNLFIDKLGLGRTQTWTYWAQGHQNKLSGLQLTETFPSSDLCLGPVTEKPVRHCLDAKFSSSADYQYISVRAASFLIVHWIIWSLLKCLMLQV